MRLDTPIVSKSSLFVDWICRCRICIPGGMEIGHVQNYSGMRNGRATNECADRRRSE